MAEIKISPIGFFHGPRYAKASVPRQGSLSQQKGYIQFSIERFDSVSALQGLERMSHCWILFSLHEARSPAKPLVRPPRKPETQVGVWATRSPYRPNGLGLTLARIEKVEGKKLFLSEVDLLDQTPVFDIKPYVAESDRPRKPIQMGWIEEIEDWTYQLSSKAKKKAFWLFENGLVEILDVFESQFGTTPLQDKRKRVSKEKDFWILSYRTWRIQFQIDKKQRESKITDIFSGYAERDLLEDQDPYKDKNLHRNFLKTFKPKT